MDYKEFGDVNLKVRQKITLKWKEKIKSLRNISIEYF